MTRQDFSLVLGGPLFQLLRRMHVAGDALELIRRRIVVAVALTWLPLLALAIFDREAWGGAAVPFLLDVEANVRFLVAVPLPIVAELGVHQRMRLIVREFLDRHLISEAALPRFDAAIQSAFRWRDSQIGR